ncbi:FCD domain-containing protein [Poseidonocella sp. HB161398]|uniref:FCD domain-containing protein n=1 Tax=Poseidonocella sp. HB161398 TaxID=2320855 RepID=UPI001109F47D|nr:FCD domain-containing protein [Poseidonocella sp. HB161398]
MSQTRRYQDVAALIRGEIARRKLPPGTRLDTERQWSQSLGVSRSLVREAVIMLEIQGLVEVRQGSGIYLLEEPEQLAPAPQDDIGPFELLQARQLLESSIAAFAAEQVTKGDILKMRDALEAERTYIEAGGGPDYSSDELFHRLIAEATQNSVLTTMVEELWAARDRSPMWARLHARVFNQDYRANWLDDHQAILDALRARNPEAARRAMWAHLGHVRETLLEVSDVDDPAFDGYLFPPVPEIGRRSPDP